MDEKIRNLLNWSKGIKEHPLEIQINPTNKCNLNCLFCRPKDYVNVKEKDVIPLSKWVSLIKEASEFGVKHWNILGGEPFSESEKTLKIMETIKKEGMRGIISTNGTLITENIIKKLIDVGWDEIVFSLDSPNSKIHDYLRDMDNCFEKCVNTIKLIEKYKRIKKMDKPILQLYFVITNKNYKDLPEFIDLADSLNIKRICFQAMIETYPSCKGLTLNKKELKELQDCIKIADLKSKEKGVITNILDFLDCSLIEKANRTDEILEKDMSKSNIFCLEPWYLMQISPEGYTNPCCSLNSKKINIKDNSLQELWYGSFFEKFRKQIISGKLNKKCSVCCSGQILRNRELIKNIEKHISEFNPKKYKFRFKDRISLNFFKKMRF